jgi:glutamate--cysteine ligase
MDGILREFVCQNYAKSMDWLDYKFSKNLPLIYNSADLRFSGYKISTVDTNAFPAGFVNLDEVGRKKASLLLKDYFLKRNLHPKKVLIISENHTRNLKYLGGLKTLLSIVNEAGFEGEVSALDAARREIELDGEMLILPSFTHKNGEITLENGFKPDFIILNNDLTGEGGEFLSQITTPMSPGVDFGWNVRTKTNYFRAYNDLVEQFARDFDIDSWFFSCIFEEASEINFHGKQGLDELTIKTNSMLQKIQKKYDEYKIKDAPVVFIKANSGTYGMGVISVKNPDEIANINKDNRKKMHKGKHGVQTSTVIIQEGIHSVITVNQASAEAVSYIVNGQIAGIFHRFHEAKDQTESLNSVGAGFENIPIEPDLQNLYEIVGKLAALACCFE